MFRKLTNFEIMRSNGSKDIWLKPSKLSSMNIKLRFIMVSNHNL